MNKFSKIVLSSLAGYILLCSVIYLTARPPQTILSSHPRMILNDTIPDTWEPSKSRLKAVSDRALPGGNATAISDFTLLKTYITSTNPSITNYSNTDANLDVVWDYTFAYLVYHKAGQDSTANPYCSSLWNTFSAAPAAVNITAVSVIGGIATAIVASTAGLSNGGAGVWGIQNDLLDGNKTITVTSGTTFTFSAVGVSNGTYPITSGAAMVSQNGDWIGFNTQFNDSGVRLTQWSYFYDGCYDWLVANSHDQYTRDQIKTGYWQETLTRQSSQFGQTIRESDFHNYSSWSEYGILVAGIVLNGDDAFGASILSEGVGYLISGVSNIQPAGASPEVATYNVQISKNMLTGGAMNWEGPTYWRAGTLRFLEALEAYDSASNGTANVFGTGGPYNNAVNAAWYKVYLRQPDGKMANFGDGGNGNNFARENPAIAILNTHFQDGHFQWFMDNVVSDPWNDGGNGELALPWKIALYPYLNGPASHDFTDLPLARRFGPDVIMRTGWGANDTFLTYTSSLHGTYHRHDDGGTIQVFRQKDLITGQPYTLADPAYTNYNRRTNGGNSITVRDPNDCWRDNAATCGIDVFGNYLVNDGGQMPSFRRWFPQFDSAQYAINRIWSGTEYSNNSVCNTTTGETCASIYSAIDPINQPSFVSFTGGEYLINDLTGSYVNKYSGSGDNPNVKVDSTNGVVRALIHFQPNLGSLTPIFVFDRVKSTNSSFVKALSFHTINAPTVNGTPMSAGDTTTNSATVTSFDNGTGRMFISHLAPTSNVRTTGGNACTPITITGATNANPAVFAAAAHGLVAHEPVGIATGAQPDDGSGPQTWPNWLIDRYFSYHGTSTIPDSGHFTIDPGSQGVGADSTGWAAFATSMASGTGTPTASVPDGYMWYQTDATAGNHVWIHGFGSWQHLVGTSFASALITNGPIVYSHSTCNYAFYVDQMGPAGTTQTPLLDHLWNGSMDLASLGTTPNWVIQVNPSVATTQDYFLTVLNPTTTSVSSVTTGTVSGSGITGGMVSDTSGWYVGVFCNSFTACSGFTYTATHSGAGQHILTGLTPNTSFAVTRSGVVVGSGTTNSLGVLPPFTETGGGTFTLGPSTPQPNAAVNGLIKGNFIIH